MSPSTKAPRRSTSFRVGDHVRILLEGPPQVFDITGIVRFGTADNLAGATIAAFQLTTAQKLFGEVGRYDAIDVLAKPGVNKKALEPGDRGRASSWRSGGERQDGHERADECHQYGAGFLLDCLARVRVHLVVRRRFHHLQHVLDPRRAAHARLPRCFAYSGRAGGRSSRR